MDHWLKIGYFSDAEEAAAGYWIERTWVSDSPGRSSPRWEKRPRPRKGVRRPPYGPQYKVGDRLVVYITRKGVCPAILEVTAEPRWDPGFVDERSGRGEGKDWGVVTEVRGLWSLTHDAAPRIEDLGIAKSRIQRRGHLWLDEEEYERAERAIAGTKAGKRPRRAPKDTRVAIEGGNVEDYAISSPASGRRAVRREARLVRDYATHLEAGGDKVARNKLLPEGSSHALYSDLFNESRGQLIEAKAGIRRGDVRMAIGQLADYARFLPGGTDRAALFDARPGDDLLALLTSEGIAAVWRNGDGFVDNARGRFV